MKQTFKIKNHVNSRKYIFGSLTGAVIGAGIGILFAPDKGSKPEKNERWF
jgi:gas vesicle protein